MFSVGCSKRNRPWIIRKPSPRISSATSSNLTSDLRPGERLEIFEEECQIRDTSSNNSESVLICKRTYLESVEIISTDSNMLFSESESELFELDPGIVVKPIFPQKEDD